ncbi:hypothetical protein ES703_25320 [subsurface metagenome]
MVSRYLKLVLIALIAFFVYLLLGCAAAPEVVEEEEPVPERVAVAAVEKPEEKPEKKPEEVTPPPEKVPEKIEPVTDREIQKVRNAIARAKEADADYYEPETLGDAEGALKSALSMQDSDPTEARKQLKEAKRKADSAYDLSVAKAVAALQARMQRMVARLKSIDAHRFLPGEYQAAVSGVEKSDQLYKRGDIVEAREQAFVSLVNMSDLNENLTERQRWISILKRDIDQYLQQAEDLEAHIRAPEQFERANQLYLQGIEAYQKYQLFESEELLGSAREAALAVIKLSQSIEVEERKRTKELMLQVMRELEEASGLTVVTDEGTVIEPEAWSGDDFLPENQSFLIPHNRETVVLGDIVAENFLKQAKELWKKGVEEWNKGNYRLAEEYFIESRRFSEAYKMQSVNTDYPVYVVRLIPGRRDCLWRIAGYEYIYNNPYLWPKIWRRNRKLIQHPDLIQPGWKLVIPPE